MTYNILWSNRSYGGAEIYVRAMKKQAQIPFICIKGMSVKSKIKLLFLLINPNNSFIFHDTRASLLSLLRILYFKDHFVLHGPGKNPILNRLLFKIFSIYAKKIILVSGHIYEKLPNKSFMVLENTSKLNTEINVKSGDCIYYGRIEESKGINHLCKTWDEQNTNSRLHIVGGGSQLNTLQKQYSDKITFHGPKNHTELESIIKNCTFYISFSQREGKSLSLDEALSVGLIPIVAHIPTQVFIHSQLSLPMIAADLSNASDILNFYLTLNENKRLEMSKLIKKYYQENTTDEWASYWNSIKS